MNASTYVTPLGLVTISLRKINPDNLNERDDYGVPISEQQYTHGFCYISLFEYKNSPKFRHLLSYVVL